MTHPIGRFMVIMAIKTHSTAHAPQPPVDNGSCESPRHVLSMFGTDTHMGATIYFDQNSEIYGENEPADYVYKVLSGTVRTYKVLNDGRRQVGAFYLPGDVFGLEIGDEHTFSSEAITDSSVLVVKRSTIIAQAGRDHAVARELWAATARELRRTRSSPGCFRKARRARRHGTMLSTTRSGCLPELESGRFMAAIGDACRTGAPNQPFGLGY